MPLENARSANCRKYKFPLANVPDAAIELPVPLDRENFESLKEQVEAWFRIAERAIVLRAEPEAAAAALRTEVKP